MIILWKKPLENTSFKGQVLKILKPCSVPTEKQPRNIYLIYEEIFQELLLSWLKERYKIPFCSNSAFISFKIKRKFYTKKICLKNFFLNSS